MLILIPLVCTACMLIVISLVCIACMLIVIPLVCIACMLIVIPLVCIACMLPSSSPLLLDALQKQPNYGVPQANNAISR